MSRGWDLLTAATALASAACAGAFWTYSTFTTSALRRLPDADAMAAMQAINVAAPRSVSFMALVFVPGAACLALAAHAVVSHRPGRAVLVAAAVVYLVGVVGMTVAFHVPRNEALATLDAATQHGGWDAWLSAWVAGNHVRTVGGLVASALLLVSWASRDAAPDAAAAPSTPGQRVSPGHVGAD